MKLSKEKLKLIKKEKKRQKRVSAEKRKADKLMDDFYNNVYLVGEDGKITRPKVPENPPFVPPEKGDE